MESEYLLYSILKMKTWNEIERKKKIFWWYNISVFYFRLTWMQFIETELDVTVHNAWQANAKDNERISERSKTRI